MLLTTHLNSLPLPKFVVIQDTLEERGRNLFSSIINNHLKCANNQVHYFVFEGNFERTKKQFDDCKIHYHDFATKQSDFEGRVFKDFNKSVSVLKDNNNVIVIDSVVHMIYTYGIGETCRLLHHIICNQPGIQQIVTVFHLDLLEDSAEAVRFVENLSTLNIVLEGKIGLSNKPRLLYIFKKQNGKIVRKLEEYWYENGAFITQDIEKPDTSKILDQATNTVLPEQLATFNIVGLNERAKELKEQLVLPYLPKNVSEGVTQSESEGGQIIYQMDEMDDWDEEDPDDDLGI